MTFVMGSSDAVHYTENYDMDIVVLSIIDMEEYIK
jgi:hypothetical protein